MRLPVRPAPAPPKTIANGSNYRKGGRPPLQRSLTNVGIEWVDPWNESEETNHASSICHSMSAMQLSDGNDHETKKRKTPPPRPPPPRFVRTNRTQNSQGSSRTNQRTGSSGLLSAIFSSRRPARKPQKGSEKRHGNNGRKQRPLDSSQVEEEIIIFETCPQKGRQAVHLGSKSNQASSKISGGQYKTESPPLLDLLTSSPPSSPVLSSRFGGSTGADTDSLSSDGFSKVGAGNAFAPAFPLDDDPFDPFGERINGGASTDDPWAGEDPFSRSPAPRGGRPVGTFEDPWITNSNNNNPNVLANMKIYPQTTGGSSYTFEEQDDWPLPAVRSTTSSPIGNSDLLSASKIPSSSRNESRSVSNPNIRNLNLVNGNSSSRTTQPCDVPRTMNLAILGAMPTIIRAKPRPKERSRLEEVATLEEVVGSSPPMPSVPPPPPPPTTFLDDWDGEAEHPPDLPPRPWQQEEDSGNGENGNDVASGGTREQPHGIALFDYPATHADDLPFQTGDVILLIRKINDDWYYGRKEIGGPPGMFPSTFIRPVIDLSYEKDGEISYSDCSELDGAGIGWSQDCMKDNRMVKALYTFKPEVAEDLEFEEGANVEVTAQLDSEWLWGRVGNKWGQFPASFVDRVPRGLPQHHP